MSDLTGTIDDKGKKKKPDGVAKQVVLKPPKKGVAGTDEHTNLRVWKRDVVNHENAREESSERNLGFHKKKKDKVHNFATGTSMVAEEGTTLGSSYGQVYAVSKDGFVKKKADFHGKDLLGGFYSSAVSHNYNAKGDIKGQMTFRKGNLLGGLLRNESSTLDAAGADGALSNVGYRQRFTMGWGMVRAQTDKNGNVTKSKASSKLLGLPLYSMKATKVSVNAEGGTFTEKETKFLGGLFKKSEQVSAAGGKDGPTIKTSTISFMGFKVTRVDDSEVPGNSVQKSLFGFEFRAKGTESANETLAKQKTQAGVALALFRESVDIYGNKMEDHNLLGRANSANQMTKVSQHYKQNAEGIMGTAREAAIQKTLKAQA